jgi:hypothetical protein
MGYEQLLTAMEIAFKKAITEKETAKLALISGMCYLAQESMKILPHEGFHEHDMDHFSVYFAISKVELVIIGIEWYGQSYGDTTSFPASFVCERKEASLIPIKVEIPNVVKILHDSRTLHLAYVYDVAKGPSFRDSELKMRGYDAPTRFLLSEWVRIQDPFKLEEFGLSGRPTTPFPETPCVIETDEQYIALAVDAYVQQHNVQVDEHGLPLLSCFGVDLALPDPLKEFYLEKDDNDSKFVGGGGLGLANDYYTCGISIETRDIARNTALVYYLAMKKKGYLIIHDITYIGVPAARAAYHRLVDIVETKKRLFAIVETKKSSS